MSETKWEKPDFIDGEVFREAGETDGFPEISHVITISTEHIRPEAASLLDADAVELIVWKKDKYGYVVMTIGWELYGEDIPEDLRACVQYAAEHNCDWLCLDGDAKTVQGLPLYEWRLRVPYTGTEYNGRIMECFSKKICLVELPAGESVMVKEDGWNDQD